MMIEFPGHSYNPIADINYYFEWTLDPEMHLDPVPLLPGYRFRYLVHVLLHEFGHTLGLEDLSDHDIDGYLMSYHPESKIFTEIPEEEVDYVRQVYRAHTPQALPATTDPRPPLVP